MAFDTQQFIIDARQNGYSDARIASYLKLHNVEIPDDLFGAAETPIEGVPQAQAQTVDGATSKTTYGQFKLGKFGRGVAKFAGAVGSSLADIVRQPGTAAAELGAGIGEDIARIPSFQKVGVNIGRALGLDAAEAASIQRGLMSRSFLGEGGRELEAISPTRQPEKFAGSAVTALGNLSTGFTAGLGTPLAFGVQGGVLGTGRGLEQEKPLGGVIIEGATTALISYGIAKAMDVIGHAVKEGVRPYVADRMKNLYSKTSGIPKSDVKWATDPKNAPNVLPKMKELARATEGGERTRAVDGMRQELLNVGRTVVKDAQKQASQNYDDAMAPLIVQYSDDIVDEKQIFNAWKKTLTDNSAQVTGKGAATKVALRGDPADDQLVYRAVKTLYEQKDFSLAGLVELKRKIYPTMSAAEPGGVASKVLGQMYHSIDDIMNTATAGETATANAEYAAFKTAQDQLYNIWGRKVSSDTALNTVAAMTNQSKGGSRTAMIELEKLAGKPGLFTDQLRAVRVADAFARETPLPGTSRLMDDLLRTVFVGAPTAAGAVLGGPVGGATGFAAGTTGAYTASRLTAPKVIGELLLKSAISQPQLASGPIRQLISELILSPLFQTAVIRTIDEMQNPEEVEATLDEIGVPRYQNEAQVPLY